MKLKWKIRMVIGAGAASLLLASLAGAATVAVVNQSFSFCVNKNVNRQLIVGATCPGGAGYKLATMPYKRTKSIDNNQLAGVRTAVIVVHGESTKPSSVYDPVIEDWDLADEEDATGGSVAVFGPQFYREDKLPAGNPTILRWDNDEPEGWLRGDASLIVSSEGVSVSSFDVMDYLVKRIKQKAGGSLTEIVIAGHSAGGQFVNRYSIATRIESDPDLAGVNFRYVIASPRSYMYLSPERYASKGEIAPAAMASPSTGCAHYNRYRYGVETHNVSPATPGYDDIPSTHYIRWVSQASPAAGAADFIDNVKNKNRLFLIGDEDVELLDTSPAVCELLLQGDNRTNRMLTYMHHLRKIGAANNVAFCIARHTPFQEEGHTGEVLGLAAMIFNWKRGERNCGYYTRSELESGPLGQEEIPAP